MTFSLWKIGLLTLLAIFLHSCGLGEYGRDDDNKYIHIRIPDPAFARYCLEHWDLNGDGYISRYEAQRVWEMDCSLLDIYSLTGIEEFTALRRLDCSGNKLAGLDLRKCVYLERLNCSGNQLVDLDIKGLRSLYWLNCSNNDLTALDLGTAAALENLWCGRNQLVVLDISFCATDMTVVETTPGEDLAVLYKRVGQRIQRLSIDGWTKVEER